MGRKGWKAAEGGTGDVFFKRILAARLTVEGGEGEAFTKSFPRQVKVISLPMPRKCFNGRYTKSWFGFFGGGALFPRTADPIVHESLCLHPPTAGICPKTLHLDLVNPLWPEGDSIQVLPAAVSFWKRERYRRSYRGWALTQRVLL